MKNPFPANSMGLIFKVQEDGNFSVLTTYNLDDLPEEESLNCQDLLVGMQIMMEKCQEVLGMLGDMTRLMGDFIKETSEAENINPDDDIFEAMRERLVGNNIIPLNKDKLN